jgi:hypothetical protein
VSVFEPSELGVEPTTDATWLLGYPIEHTTLGN